MPALVQIMGWHRPGARIIFKFYNVFGNAANIDMKHKNTHIIYSLQWRHDGHDGVSNHQPHYCLLNNLFRSRWKKNQSSASLAFLRIIHRWPVDSPHKWPVTRKMFPFDDVIMWYGINVPVKSVFNEIIWICDRFQHIMSNRSNI